MLIELKNVSKFYYSKGIIASGFSRVNLSFNVGEFVVITGESGSGKSTLLNVISGLDSYEEGEMYIEGQETSHYLATDFEEYRKKYIGNIFQNFNLIGSYTVYQNVELILRINGYSKEEIRQKVPSILERVGLSEYSKTKVSKLSGGQKQRVAIARALAKDTAIVVADEPTGNLDSESAMGIVKLLSEISKDKLVIVVTHNYDQFEHYATRKIKMHDGKVVEDEHLRQVTTKSALPQTIDTGDMPIASKIRLGIRNTFNILPKFLLLLIVFMFIVLAVTGVYTNYQYNVAERQDQGWNDYFSNYRKERIIVKKEDGSAFTEEDYAKLQKMNNIKSIFPEDIVLDSSLYVENDEFSFDGYPQNIRDFTGTVDYGKLPEKNNEILLVGYNDSYWANEGVIQEAVGKKATLYSDNGNIDRKVTVSGVALIDREEDSYWYGGCIYLTDATFKKLIQSTYVMTSTITTTVADTELVCEGGDLMYCPVANKNVNEGEIIVPDELDGYYKNGRTTGQVLNIKAKNIYYTKSLDLKVANTYNKKNYTVKTGLKTYENHESEFYVNPKDYKKLFDSKNYQISVYMKDANASAATKTELEKAGYQSLVLKDMLISSSSELLSIIQVPMNICLLLAVFFISYFVIHLILRSRNSYFSILRMLGLAKRNIRRIMDVELFVIVNIAYGLFLFVIKLIDLGIVHIEYLQNLMKYMGVSDYLLLYLVLIVMSYLISGRFVRKMFKKTAMGSFREEE